MKKKITITSTFFALVLVLMFFNQIVDFVINVKWFNEVGYISVYFTKLAAVIKLFIPIFIVCFIAVYFYYKSLRKNIMRMNYNADIVSKPGKLERSILVVIDLVVSFVIASSVANSYWYRILLFSNSTNFNVKDPIFGMDISMFMFKMPLIESLYQTGLSILIFLVMVTLVTYFVVNARDRIYSGDIRQSFSKVTSIRSGLTKFAGKQLAIISSLILLFMSLGYLIKSWNLVYSPRGIVFGAGYTDIHVNLMFYRVLIVVCLIAAIIIFVSVITSKVKPIIASIGFIIFVVIIQGISGQIVQNFLVKSNQKTLEAPYIKYNIDYTRQAFNLDNIDIRPFDVKNNLTQNDIASNKDIINNIRINAFEPALEFYNQVQTIRYYYKFNDIDIDRYNVNGTYNQVFIAPREINTQTIDPNTWQNKHLIYTHGYGIVMSKVNSVTSEGQPDFVIKDIPPENNANVDLKNSRIYFGEKTNDYAIVNTNIDEVDYPKGGDNQTNKYDGKAGINMSILNRVLFSINQKNINFLLSRDINSNSKILINRNVVDRVNKIAPFLTYDKDPYIVVANGKLYWIIDAYTVSDRYPFSQPQGDINYMRNSVKVIIDAMDGVTNFYIVDKNDPIISSYAKIFPKLFKDISEVPKELKDHFRYPEDIFNIQNSVLGKYHMTDPGVFYNGEDLWEVSKTTKQAEEDKSVEESPYVVMRLPESKQNEMMLLSYFNMKNKPNMSAMVGARMDGENYGKMFMYVMPSQRAIISPLLFQQKLQQDPNISKELTLWGQQGSGYLFGDIIIVPINDSLLYVEPVYLRATGKNSIPEVKRVIVSYGEKMISADNIESALAQIFNIDQNIINNNTPNNTGTPPATTIGSEVVKQAKDLLDKAIEAQKAGDWAKYGEYIKKLGELLSK